MHIKLWRHTTLPTKRNMIQYTLPTLLVYKILPSSAIHKPNDETNQPLLRSTHCGHIKIQPGKWIKQKQSTSSQIAERWMANTDRIDSQWCHRNRWQRRWTSATPNETTTTWSWFGYACAPKEGTCHCTFTEWSIHPESETTHQTIGTYPRTKGSKRLFCDSQ